MATTLAVGHKLELAIMFLDQNGNPMLTTPTPDTAPTWANTTPATEVLTPAASGLTAEGIPAAPGSDTVTLNVTVGGVAFTATLDVTVTASPQVLTSVGIAPTVV